MENRGKKIKELKKEVREMEVRRMKRREKEQSKKRWGETVTNEKMGEGEETVVEYITVHRSGAPDGESLENDFDHDGSKTRSLYVS